MLVELAFLMTVAFGGNNTVNNDMPNTLYNNVQKDVFSRLATPLGSMDISLYYATVRAEHSEAKTTYRYVQKQDITSHCDVRECFRSATDVLETSKQKRSDYVLVVRLGGDINSVDEVALKSCRFDADDIRIILTVIKVESADVEPYPVEAFILIPLNESILSKQGLVIDSDGYYRSFEGALSHLKSSPIEAISIKLTPTTK